LENAKAIEKREEKVRQSRDEASTIQHLQKLNDEISKLFVSILLADILNANNDNN
jgi:DNA-binding IscR family transcriptional regulator